MPAPARSDTRTHILESAWELARERGAGALTMSAIARASRLSRQAVHMHFPTRADLLAAMAAHHDRASGFVARVVASRELEPVAGFAELLRQWCAYIPEIHPVARALDTADPAGRVTTARMADLRAAFRIALDRIAETGRLAAGWDAAHAADWAWARAHLSNWHHVVVECGWDADDFADVLVESVLGELVSPSP